MPTAVITESSENTMSMIAICRITLSERRARRAASRCCSSPSRLLVDLERALREQEQAAADQDQVAPGDAAARRP